VGALRQLPHLPYSKSGPGELSAMNKESRLVDIVSFNFY